MKNQIIGKKTMDRTMDLVILFLLWNTFFSNTIVFSSIPYSSILIMLLMSAFPLLYLLQNTTIGKIAPVETFWMLFVLLLFLDSFFAPDKAISLAISTLKLCVFLVFYFLCHKEGWYKKFWYGMLICSAVYIIFGLLQIFFPSIVEVVAHILLPSQSFNINQTLYYAGYHAGIASQVGYQVHFILPALAYSFSVVLIGGKKKSTYFMLLMFVVACVALIATNKRMALVATIGTIAFCCLIAAMLSKQKKIRKMLILVAAMGFGAFVLLNTEIGAHLMERFMNTTGVDRGREMLWSQAIVLWKSSPLIGVGTNYYSQTMPMSCHNVFLQILCENGVVGLVLYLCVIMLPLLKSLNVLKKLDIQRKPNDIKIYVLASIFIQTFCLIHSFTESIYNSESTFLPYIAAGAVSYSIARYHLEFENRQFIRRKII